MICPNCQSGDVVVRDSRAVAGERQRRRKCRSCNAVWFTHEVMVEGSLAVVKTEPAWWSQARRLNRAGWTQKQIAKMCNVTQGMVSRALKPSIRARINAKHVHDPEVYNLKRRARQEARA